MKITTESVKALRDATGAGILDCKYALEAHGGDMEQALEYLRKRGLQKAAAKASRVTGDGLIVVKTAGEVAVAVHVGCETDFVARTRQFRSFVHELAHQVLASPSLTDTSALLDAEFRVTPGKKVHEFAKELVMQLGENITVNGVARYAEAPGRVVDAYIHAGEIEGYGAEEGRIGVLVEVSGKDSVALCELAHDLALHIAASNPRYVAVSDIPEDVLAAHRKERQMMLDEDKPADIKARIVEGGMNKWQQEVVLLQQPLIREPQLSVAAWLAQAAGQLGAPVSVMRFARYAVGE